METQDSRVGFGIWRQSVKVEAVMSVCYAPKQRLKLVTLERARFIFVFELHDDAVFLYVSHTKWLPREWCEQRRIIGDLLDVIE
jgi:hypothetical protein